MSCIYWAHCEISRGLWEHSLQFSFTLNKMGSSEFMFIIRQKYSHITLVCSIYCSRHSVLCAAQFEITLYFKQSSRAHRACHHWPLHECSPAQCQAALVFFCPARTNNVSAIFERRVLALSRLAQASLWLDLRQQCCWQPQALPPPGASGRVCSCGQGNVEGEGIRDLQHLRYCGLPYGHLHFAYGTESHGYMCL